MSNFDSLIQQVDAFIKKYYKNQILRGLLLFVGVFIVSYLLVIGLEYVGRFTSVVRGVLLLLFIAVNGFILTKYILIPVFRLFEIGKRISRYQAADFIGKYFPEVSDRLLNTLQLKDRLNDSRPDYELLSASISQKSKKLNVISFKDAIDYKENKRYVVWLIPVFSLLIGLAIIVPGLFKQGTERVVNFTKEFPFEFPFEFIYSNTNKSLEEGEDAIIRVRLKGEEIPSRVYLKSNQGTVLMRAKSKTEYEAVLSKLHQDATFQFVAPYGEEDAISDRYEVKVVGKAAIGKLSATLNYPSYLGRSVDTIENASDLTVPEGTKVEWSVLTKNTEWTKFITNSNEVHFSKEGWKLDTITSNSFTAQILLKNKYSSRIDTNTFQVNVIKDQFPTIQVEEFKDSIKDGVRYFTGHVNDDYGINRIVFHYSINRKDGSKISKSIPVIGKTGTDSPFNYAVDFRKEELQLEDQIEYSFIVFDNDGVNGSKSTSSRVFVYKLPTLDELNEQRSEDQENAKDALKDALKNADEFKKNVERFRKDLTGSKQSQWQKQNQLNQLKEQHESLLEQLQNLNNEMENSIEEKNQLSEIDQDLLEQQQAIEDLLEELMDDEMKDLLDQLQEMLEQRNQDKLEKGVEDLELSAEDMKKQLDRSLEALKKLQVNEKIDDLEEELKSLAEEQEILKSEMEGSKSPTEDQIEKQEEINDKFEELTNDLNELDSLNNDLTRPMDLGSPQEQSEDIKKDLEESSKQMEKGKSGKASESQQGASDKMKEMAEMLDQMQNSSNQQQQQEDIDMLRKILESLVHLSFDQEGVMNKMGELYPNDPAFVKNGKFQRKIMADTKIVSDSLYELAKRQPKIAKFIDDELNKIKVNQILSLENIDERQIHDLAIHQQYAMTSYNNLALMLNESLQQMQQQMQNMMPGSGSCNKPGGSGMPKPGEGMNGQDMKQMLKNQLKQMEKGQQEGDKGKPGEKGAGSMGMGNKEIAKMAAQQSAIRKRLEELRKELNKDGSGMGNKLNPLIDKLNQQEKELVNKRLNQDLINRQKEILTRLLESEKALMERGLDEKRESKEGKSKNLGNQIQFEEYNKEKIKQIEILRAVDPVYKQYYQNHAMQYFNKVLE